MAREACGGWRAYALELPRGVAQFPSRCNQVQCSWGITPVLQGNPRDFKLTPVWAFSQKPVSLPEVSAGLLPIRDAFSSNISRLKSQMIFWAFGLNMVRETERFEAVAEMQMTGKFSTT